MSGDKKKAKAKKLAAKRIAKDLERALEMIDYDKGFSRGQIDDRPGGMMSNLDGTPNQYWGWREYDKGAF